MKGNKLATVCNKRYGNSAYRRDGKSVFFAGREVKAADIDSF
jgi:hypothetical protein